MKMRKAYSRIVQLPMPFDPLYFCGDRLYKADEVDATITAMETALREIVSECTAAIGYEALNQNGSGDPDSIPNGLRTVAHIKLSMIREKARAALPHP